VERRLERDSDPEAMSNDLRADIVRAMRGEISDMYVTPFPICSLLTMHSYQRLCVDSC